MGRTRIRRGRYRFVWTFVGVGLILVYALGPFLWMAIASITPGLSQAPAFNNLPESAGRIQFFPRQPTLDNYYVLFRNMPFGGYMLNSAIISAGNMLLSLAVACLGAYAFVRFRFAGRNPLLVAMLTAYTIPNVVLLVPLLVIFRVYGLNNTHFGMMLAESTASAPFVLLLMINYFSTLPRELEEAALVDGCSRTQTLWRIVIPLSLPGIVAGGLLAFIMSWNNFLFAYLLTSTDDVRTLPVVMRQFAQGEPTIWGVSAAGAVLSTIPVALTFLLFQRMLINGLAAGAVKG